MTLDNRNSVLIYVVDSLNRSSREKIQQLIGFTSDLETI